ncbi:MAG: DUF4382 domain-containing protein [Proteobacteria bacterium]|nr:DUF4382 domain-containing protein [Pseudomonadota bacterium]MBU1708918.1 DUF4382 domain-containing protein [Pseudomonadota bacterium]
MKKEPYLIGTIAVVVLSVFLLFACGGGGDGTTSGAADSVGSVALFLTDSPSNDFDEIKVTIHEILLLPEDDDQEKVTIFTSDAGETIDLLKLETESTLFALDNNVPAGWYSKIRMYVSKVELCNDGEEPILAKVPANGKIDLNPKDVFYVAPGETIALELDMCADKSIHIVKKGHKDEYNFRPVIFVQVMTSEAPGKLVRLSGYIREKTDDAFILCPDQPIINGQSDLADNFPARCSVINIINATTFFDENGDQTDFADLEIGDAAQVIGKYQYSPDDPSMLLHFEAYVVEIGIFLRLEGIIQSVPEIVDGKGTFLFAISPGQGINGEVIVMAIVPVGTGVFNKAGETIALNDLEVGEMAVIDGILDVTQAPDILKAALIVSGQRQPATELTGILTDMTDDTLTVTPEGGDPVCVRLVIDTHYFKLIIDDNGFTQEKITKDDLVGNEQLRIYVLPGDPCPVAEDVFVIIDQTT